MQEAARMYAQQPPRTGRRRLSGVTTTNTTSSPVFEDIEDDFLNKCEAFADATEFFQDVSFDLIERRRKRLDEEAGKDFKALEKERKRYQLFLANFQELQQKLDDPEEAEPTRQLFLSKMRQIETQLHQIKRAAKGLRGLNLIAETLYNRCPLCICDFNKMEMWKLPCCNAFICRDCFSPFMNNLGQNPECPCCKRKFLTLRSSYVEEAHTIK